MELVPRPAREEPHARTVSGTSVREALPDPQVNDVRPEAHRAPLVVVLQLLSASVSPRVPTGFRSVTMAVVSPPDAVRSHGFHQLDV